MLNQDLEDKRSDDKLDGKNKFFNADNETETSATLPGATKTNIFLNKGSCFAMENNQIPNNIKVLSKSSNPAIDWKSTSVNSTLDDFKEVAVNSLDKVDDMEEKLQAESVNSRKITTEAEDDIMAYVNSIVSDDEVMEIQKLIEHTQKHIDEQVNKSKIAQTNIQRDAEQLGAKVRQKLEDESDECVSSTNTVTEFGDYKQATLLSGLTLKTSASANSSIDNLVNSIITIEDSPLKQIADDIIDLDSISYSSFLPEREMDTNGCADDSVIILDNSCCADMDIRNINNAKSSKKQKVSFENGSAANKRHSNGQPDDLEIVKVYKISSHKCRNNKMKSLQTSVRRFWQTSQLKPVKVQCIPVITYSTPKKTETNSTGINKENHTRAEESTANTNSNTSPKQPVKSIGDCPVCFDSLSNKEIMSTVCGHLFCMSCIMNVIRNTKCCPTCRRKLSLKSIHPIYI